MSFQIILGIHDGCNKVFCWYISEHQAKHVKAGDWLFVENRNDYAVVKAISDPICGEEAKTLAMHCGARFPLKRVISFANRVMKQEIVKSFKESVKEEIYAFHEKINALGEEQ